MGLVAFLRRRMAAAPLLIGSLLIAALLAAAPASAAKSSGPLEVLPKSIHKGTVGDTPYVPLTANGGSGHYEFTLASGAPPEGVELFDEAGGVYLSGYLSRAGTYTFTIEATDEATGATGTRQYKLVVALGFSPGNGPFPEGVIGKSYFATANVEGGSGEYTYAVTAGALPEGLSLGQEQTSATVSGTPAKAGKSKFTITGTDLETGVKISRKYSLAIRSVTFPNGTVELEEKDGEGNVSLRETSYFEIAKESKTRASGPIFGNEGTGSWSYTLATGAIEFQAPVAEGSPAPIRHGSCSEQSRECSGTGPSGTFVLREP
jgi:hypothetical protein